MPHRCQQCSTVIQDESKNLLEGCPDCNNNSWEYVESETDDESDIIEAEVEDQSQQEARTEFVDDTSLPSSPPAQALQSKSTLKNASKVDDTNKVKNKLNSQYDGIQIVDDGLYEINLTKLYRGHEYVITVGDDGAYQVKKAEDIATDNR